MIRILLGKKKRRLKPMTSIPDVVRYIQTNLEKDRPHPRFENQNTNAAVYTSFRHQHTDRRELCSDSTSVISSSAPAGVRHGASKVDGRVVHICTRRARRACRVSPFSLFLLSVFFPSLSFPISIVPPCFCFCFCFCFSSLLFLFDFLIFSAVPLFF